MVLTCSDPARTGIVRSQTQRDTAALHAVNRATHVVKATHEAVSITLWGLDLIMDL